MQEGHIVSEDLVLIKDNLAVYALDILCSEISVRF